MNKVTLIYYRKYICPFEDFCPKSGFFSASSSLLSLRSTLSAQVPYPSFRSLAAALRLLSLSFFEKPGELKSTKYPKSSIPVNKNPKTAKPNSYASTYSRLDFVNLLITEIHTKPKFATKGP